YAANLYYGVKERVSIVNYKAICALMPIVFYTFWTLSFISVAGVTFPGINAIYFIDIPLLANPALEAAVRGSTLYAVFSQGFFALYIYNLLVNFILVILNKSFRRFSLNRYIFSAVFSVAFGFFCIYVQGSTMEGSIGIFLISGMYAFLAFYTIAAYRLLKRGVYEGKEGVIDDEEDRYFDDETGFITAVGDSSSEECDSGLVYIKDAKHASTPGIKVETAPAKVNYAVKREVTPPPAPKDREESSSNEKVEASAPAAIEAIVPIAAKIISRSDLAPSAFIAGEEAALEDEVKIAYDPSYEEYAAKERVDGVIDSKAEEDKPEVLPQEYSNSDIASEENRDLLDKDTENGMEVLVKEASVEDEDRELDEYFNNELFVKEAPESREEEEEATAIKLELEDEESEKIDEYEEDDDESDDSVEEIGESDEAADEDEAVNDDEEELDEDEEIEEDFEEDELDAEILSEDVEEIAAALGAEDSDTYAFRDDEDDEDDEDETYEESVEEEKTEGEEVVVFNYAEVEAEESVVGNESAEEAVTRFAQEGAESYYNTLALISEDADTDEIRSYSARRKQNLIDSPREIEDGEIVERLVTENFAPEIMQIISDDQFYLMLPHRLKKEFTEAFMNPSEFLIRRIPQYVINGDNSEFFSSVLKYIDISGKGVSSDLILLLYEYVISIYGDDTEYMSNCNRKVLDALLQREDREKAAADITEEVCIKEIKLTLKSDLTRTMPVIKRLILIYMRKKKYDEALQLCETAIRLNFTDNTVGGYEGRRRRILRMMEKEGR
ncbi:MAG: tetratricopeptide repeat protein, partial [Parabacteroides sp.]|nr:tetratricopeptide repeat protein [Parabacteroides sp.]